MKVFHFTQTTLTPVVLAPTTLAAAAFFTPTTHASQNFKQVNRNVAAPPPTTGSLPSYQRHTYHKTTLFLHEIMSDMDSMCIANAANVCSHYDQCDVEEREAMINRFEEQKDLLARRLAEMESLSRHLKTGDHGVLEERETEVLKRKIMDSIKVGNLELLDNAEIDQLQGEILAASTSTKDDGRSAESSVGVNCYYDSLPLNWLL
eukprot:228175_1